MASFGRQMSKFKLDGPTFAKCLVSATEVVDELQSSNPSEIRLRLGMENETGEVYVPYMANDEEEPVILPFQDQAGTGWHVVIRYREGHERRIDGFATRPEALDWIIANSKQVDKQPP